MHVTLSVNPISLLVSCSFLIMSATPPCVRGSHVGLLYKSTLVAHSTHSQLAQMSTRGGVFTEQTRMGPSSWRDRRCTTMRSRLSDFADCKYNDEQRAEALWRIHKGVRYRLM